MYVKRFAMFITVMFLFSALLTGCGDGNKVATTPDTKPLRIATGPEPETLDPRISNGNPEANIQYQLFEGLCTRDKAGNILPAVAEKLTDTANGAYGLVATTGERWVALYEHLGMYALANDLNFVNAEATECVLNQGDNVQAIQYWVDLFNKGVMSQDLLLTDTGTGREQSFGNNKAAMFFGGFWAADVLKADYDMTYPEDYGIVPLEGTGGFASSTGGWIFTISRDSQHPQEALDYIAWVLSDGERLSKFTTIMPSTEAASQLSLQGEFYEPFKMLLAQPNTRHPIPLNPGLPEQAEVLRNVVQSALLGEMTAQEAADSFCQQIEGTLFQP